MNNMEQEVLNKMIKIYKPDGFDWMGTPITKTNPLTYHHIIKRKDGETSISNGALLTKSSHRKLNILENCDKDLYDEWQWLFYAINYSLTKPLPAYVEMMEELKEQTNSIIYNKNPKLSLKQ